MYQQKSLARFGTFLQSLISGKEDWTYQGDSPVFEGLPLFPSTVGPAGGKGENIDIGYLK